jgi:hypothetical protein
MKRAELGGRRTQRQEWYAAGCVALGLFGACTGGSGDSTPQASGGAGASGAPDAIAGKVAAGGTSVNEGGAAEADAGQSGATMLGGATANGRLFIDGRLFVG